MNASIEVIKQLRSEISLQITSACPLYVSDEQVPPGVLEEQRQAVTEKAIQAGKPAAVIEQIAAGALEKFRRQHVLLRQAYIRDETLTVADLLQQTAGQIGENIVIRRFLRWEICPDAEKR